MPAWLKKILGDQGERLAARFLRRRGFKILARNVSNRFGEIDIVALDGRWIVFVEVKTRRSDAAGHPCEAITYDKQKRLTRLALAFLKQHGLLEHSARFDVVAVHWPEASRRAVIEHYPNAFAPVGSGQLFS